MVQKLLCPNAEGGTKPHLKPASAGEAQMESFEKLKRVIAEIQDDVDKTRGGNKAAGTRVRKAMQELKSIAQDVRKEVLEVRDGPTP